MNPIGELLVLAERVLHDSQTDLVSTIHCLEVVAAETFPSLHTNFGVFARYRLDEEPPTETVRVDFRLLRCSVVDGEEVIAEFPGDWAAGTTRARILTNFRVLRLVRAERLLFRMEHRVGDGPWEPGPACAIDVVTAASDQA